MKSLQYLAAKFYNILPSNNKTTTNTKGLNKNSKNLFFENFIILKKYV